MDQEERIRLGVGGNQPSLADTLEIETADFRERADKLTAGAARAAITDEDSAGKAALLGKQITEWISKCDRAREERKRPFLESGRAVDQHFKGMIDPLEKAKKTVAALIKGWGDKERARLEADRRRTEAAARLAQEEADRLAALAAVADEPGAEEQAAAAADKAAELTERAAAPVHVQIDSGQGAKAHFHTVKTVKIHNLAAAFYHLIQVEREAVTEFVQKHMEKLARENKLVAVEDRMGLPGVEIGEDTATTFR